MGRGRGYKVCDVCGAALDAGEVCDCQRGEQYQGKPYRKEDKHLEACRRVGHYIQPGYRLPRRA